MKVVDKFLLKTYIGPFLMTFFVVVFVLMMQFLWKYVDDLVGKGLEVGMLLKLLYYSLFTFIPLAMPLAILLSSLITFGNLSERNELTSLKCAGIPLFRIMRPLALLVLALSVTAFVLANNVVPVMALKFTSLLHDIQSQKPALSIEEGIFYREIDNYIIRIGKKERDNTTIEDVLIYDHSRTTGYTTVTYGKRGTMLLSDNKQYLVITLEDGFVYDENFQFNAELTAAEMPVLRGTFKSQQVRFDLSSFKLQRTSEDFYKDSYEMLNVLQLNDYIDTIKMELTTNMSENRDNYFRNFRSLNYFADSALFADTTMLPVLPAFDMEKQRMVYNYAIQSSRENASLVEFFHSDYQMQEKQLFRYQLEWHRKFSLSFACFLLFLVGVPLGAIVRKGGLGIPLTLCIFIFVFYWVSSTIGERMSRLGTIPPFFGMWISSILLLPFGIWLTYKASTEKGFKDFNIFKTRILSLLSFLPFIKKKKNDESTPTL